MKGSLSFASGVATVSAAKGRFAMPKAIVNAWSLGATDKVLLGELRGPEHLRMHRGTAGKALMEAALALAKVNAQNEEDLEWRTRAIMDKFRDLSFNALDQNRITLPQEFVLALIGEAPKLKVYVESGPTSIDVMTMHVRLTRLRILENED